MSADAAAFLLSIFCGAALLCLWDILHGIRAAFFKGIFMNAVLDVFWWVCVAALPLWCFWNTNSMSIRFYEAIGAAGGALIYHIALSKPMRACFCVVFALIRKIFELFFKILLTPARILYKILIVPFLRAVKKTRVKKHVER